MSGLSGSGTLTALALRRDRYLLPAWTLTFVAVTALSAVASKDLYATTAELERLSEGWNRTAATVALHGRIYDATSAGAATLVKLTGMGTAMVGLMAILLVVRHTRADEEVGRAELAAGGAVGQHAPVTAALTVAVGTVASISVLSGLALVAAGLPPAGSAAFAAAWLGAGLVFAALAAVTAQVAVTARAARGLASAVLALTYVVRAVGDTSPPGGHRWVSWLSPLGWAQQVRPFAGDRWWALLPPLVTTFVLVGLALVLRRVRDLGGGLVVERPGPARGPRLGSALALAWRLQRWALLAWVIGAAFMGAVLGSIASSIGDLLDSPRLQEYLRVLGGVGVLQDSFMSAELTTGAAIVSAYGISAALHVRSEEAQGRAEPLLVAGVPRTRFLVAHTVLALVGASAVMAAAGAGMGLAHASTVGDAGQVGRVLAAALARLPAVWLMTALVLALFGIAGRLTPLSWVLLVGFLVVGEFGPLMGLPSWTLELSPFGHLPRLPGGDVEPAALFGLTVVAALLLAVGALTFQRRDLEPD